MNVYFQSISNFECGLHGLQFVDKNPWLINLRDDQKAIQPTGTATSTVNARPPPRAQLDKRMLAIGLGLGLPLFILLIAAFWLIYHQHRQLQRAERSLRESEKLCKSSESSTGSTLAYTSYSPSQGPSLPPPNSAYAQGQPFSHPPGSTYVAPIANVSPNGFGPREMLNASAEARPFPKDSRPVQEMRGDGIDTHELNGDAFAGLRPSRSTHKFI